MDIRKIKKLIELMEESDINEIEVKEGEESVRISRGLASNVVQSPIAPVYTSSPSARTSSDSAASPSYGGHVITAPMVGTFYQAPSPNSPPFVAVGDKVKAGDTLCIIESMKMMNEIKADRDGILEAVLVSNDSPVQYDQALFTLAEN